MKQIPHPIDTHSDAFAACVERVRDAGLRSRLLAAGAAIVAHELSYMQRARSAELHEFRDTTETIGVTGAELVALYNRMTAKRSKGRVIYDRILSSPPHGRCPLCNCASATTLDHHLPKARFPGVAVAPCNLVPACRDCQASKLQFVPVNRVKQTLHPYFEDPNKTQWLTASIVEEAPLAVSYRMDIKASSDTNSLLRYDHHMKVLGLHARYAELAGVELAGIRHRLATLHEAGGKAAVEQHLLEEAESRSKVDLNGWQAVLYRASASSDWYCDGGFRHAA